MLVPSLIEIGPVVLEMKMKMWKFYDKDDANNNADGKRTKFRWAKDACELSIGDGN